MKDLIAKTIHRQILTGQTADDTSGVTAAMCWGAHNWAAIHGDRGKGGLSFEVMGSRFAGKVTVILGFLDTYDISFTDKDNLTVENHNVYAFDLTKIIDLQVEMPLEEMPVCP
tara:strand:- start:5011 stop:5349 length:339 start_codon:yes stop_codon:yes gene_type:complete